MSADSIVVAANFTAEPIREVVGFWVRRLGLSIDVSFAPYDQVFQQLLDSSSLLRQNVTGLNILLLKLDNWSRTASNEPVSGAVLNRNVAELVVAVAASQEDSPAPLLLIFTPASPDTMADPEAARLLADAERSLWTDLHEHSAVYLVRSNETMAMYPVEFYHDPESEALGGVPYTEEYFAAIGTMIGRRLRAMRFAPYKALALDCDNTLWNGVAGELGATGVEVNDACRAWQQFIVEQREAGMLICLCSKNNEADVGEVFRCRPDMPLALDHITASRINWGAKSENLKSLAEELDLALDSIVFVDDSPFEIAEVRAQCPEVVALKFPSDPAGIPAFIRHTWVFDRLAVTSEDRLRARSYRENRSRDSVRKQAGSLEEFLRDLQLEVEIVAPAPAEFGRAAQMTQRTNQFNTTTIRRTEPELRHLCADATIEARIVRVRDRFGDYGIVGLMLYQVRAKALYVDSMMLSCRALGRRVEHRMLAELGWMAEQCGCSVIDLPAVPTARNAPTFDFLNSLATSGKSVVADTVFRIPCDVARNAPTIPFARHSGAPPAEDGGSTASAGADNAAMGELLTRTATELSSPGQILAAIDADRQKPRPPSPQTYVAPRTAIERRIAQIWRESLHIDAIGVHDRFFDLGGDSLTAVAVFARLGRALGMAVSPTLLFRASTVGQLAAILEHPHGNGSGTTTPLTSLIPIQASGTRPPLFCVHAGAGTVLFYQGLAVALGSEQPMYALQSQGLYDQRMPHASVEEMAAHYVSELISVQPEGPYQVAGFCFGATVAFEMSQQLRRAGRRVSLLASFDGVAPHYPRESGRATDFARLDLPTRVAYPRWAAIVPTWARRTMFRQHDEFRALGRGDRMPYFRRKVADRITRRLQQVRSRIFGAYQARHGGPVPQLFRRFRWYFVLNNHLAKQRYRPGAYEGDIAVFTIKGRYPSPDLGWGNWVTGGVSTVEVAGELRHHRDLMDHPMVSRLADALRSRLVGDEDRPR